MRIDGACHCGEVRYQAEVDPEKVALCNCTDCQTLSGSAFRVNVFVDESALEFLSGEPVEYVKTGESGNKRVQAFCGACGTGLYATSAGETPGNRSGFGSRRVAEAGSRRVTRPAGAWRWSNPASRSNRLT